MNPSSKSTLVLVLTAMFGTSVALGAAPAQAGLQTLGPGRSLQSPAPPNKVVIPAVPSTVFPISSLPYTIVQPGYYQLTKDLDGVPGEPGIRVGVPDAIIDLNGFALDGGSDIGTLSGIECGIFSRTTVFNGSIAGWGEDGIEALAGSVVVINVASSGNGRNGLQLGGGSVVQDCELINNSAHGILGGGLTVMGCEAAGNDGDGIHATGSGLFVSHSHLFSNRGLGVAVADQILGSSPCVIEDCQILGNDLGGVRALGAAQVQRCNVTDNKLDGIHVGPSSHVDNCVVVRNDTGIRAGAGSSVCDSDVMDNELEGIIGSDDVTLLRCDVSRNKAGATLGGKGCRIEACTFRANQILGVHVTSDSLVSNNGLFENQGPGLLVSGDANRVEGNHATANATGIDVQGRRNLIVRNSLDSNGVQMQIAADNIQGPFLKTKGFVQSDNPWANFDLSFPTTFP